MYYVRQFVVLKLKVSDTDIGYLVKCATKMISMSSKNDDIYTPSNLYPNTVQNWVDTPLSVGLLKYAME